MEANELDEKIGYPKDNPEPNFTKIVTIPKAQKASSNFMGTTHFEALSIWAAEPRKVREPGIFLCAQAPETYRA